MKTFADPKHWFVANLALGSIPADHKNKPSGLVAQSCNTSTGGGGGQGYSDGAGHLGVSPLHGLEFLVSLLGLETQAIGSAKEKQTLSVCPQETLALHKGSIPLSVDPINTNVD